MLQELLRVLKRKGRIVLIDVDYGSASVDLDDAVLERKMMAYCAVHLRPHGLAARKFYRLLMEAGIRNVQAESYGLTFTDLDESPFGSMLVDAALQDGYIQRREASRWMQTLGKRNKEGKFFGCINMLLVSGTKA